MVQNEFPELLKMYEIKDSQPTQPEPTEQQLLEFADFSHT